MPDTPRSDPFAQVLGGRRGSDRAAEPTPAAALSTLERARLLVEWMHAADEGEDLIAFMAAFDERADELGLTIRGGVWRSVDGGPAGLHLLLVYEEDELLAVIDGLSQPRLLRHDQPLYGTAGTRR